MKYKVLNFMIVIIVGASTLSCIQENNYQPIKINPADNLELKSEEILDNAYYLAIARRLDKTDLEILALKEVPDRSEEIRVWTDFGLSYSGISDIKGFILEQNNGKWSATYVPSLDSAQTPYSLSIPKSGWSKFIEKLENFEIGTFPHQKDRAKIDEGKLMLIEIKKSNFYRIYYHNGLGIRKTVESKKMLELCNFIDIEFDIGMCEVSSE